MSLPESRAFCPKNYIISAAGGAAASLAAPARTPMNKANLASELFSRATHKVEKTFWLLIIKKYIILTVDSNDPRFSRFFWTQILQEVLH